MRLSANQRRSRRAVIISVAAMSLITACAGGGETTTGASGDRQCGGWGGGTPDAAWTQTVKAAEKEGTVIFYSSAIQGTIDRLETAFEEWCPQIDMQTTRATGIDVTNALKNEKTSRGSKADIVLQDPQPWLYQNLGEFVAPTGPNTKNPVYQTKQFTLGGVAQMHHVVPFGIAYNTTIVTEKPKDFTALADPKLKGLVGLFDFASPASADLYTFLERNYGGEEFLKKLAAQDPQYLPSVAPMLQALSTGEIAITDYANLVGVLDLKAKGAPVDFAGTTPQWGIQFYTYIVNWADHKNSAQVLYDFMASPEGQKVINQNAISALPNIQGTFAPIDGVQPMNVENAIDPAKVESTNARLRTIFGR